MADEHVTHTYELSESSMWALLIGAVTLITVAIAICVSLHYTKVAKAAFEAGYEQTMRSGSQGYIWTKAKE